MWREALRVRTDPRYSQMRDRLRALAAAWRTYRNERETQQVLRRMTDVELRFWAVDWPKAQDELRRRGLPVPQGVTHA